MKADEVRLYALRGGLTKQAVCYTHFHSNEVFRVYHKYCSINLDDTVLILYNIIVRIKARYIIYAKVQGENQ